MKITRDYILGLGSGLVISALIMFAMQWSGFGVVSDNNSATDTRATAETNSDNTASEIRNNEVLSGQQQDNIAEDKASSGYPTEKNSAPSQEISFTVPNGAGASTIANLLEQQGIITDKQIFMDAANRLNLANKFQAGTFTLRKGLSVYEIISLLIQNPE